MLDAMRCGRHAKLALKLIVGIKAIVSVRYDLYTLPITVVVHIASVGARNRTRASRSIAHDACRQSSRELFTIMF